MKIEIVKVGYLETNCYIVTKGKETIIIDPGDEAGKIIKAGEEKNIVGILVTHHHSDHIGSLKEIEEYYHLKANEINFNWHMEILKTPGHTADSLSFYFPKEQVLFSGDFIFLDSIGRCDLPTGDFKKMQASLKMISSYPDKIIIYPGHGKATTLGYEKQNFKYYGGAV